MVNWYWQVIDCLHLSAGEAIELHGKLNFLHTDMLLFINRLELQHLWTVISVRTHTRLKLKTYLVLPGQPISLCLWSAQTAGGLLGSGLKGERSHLRVGAGDDYVDLAKIHRQRWLFVRICFVIKKLISTGVILVLIYLSAHRFCLLCLLFYTLHSNLMY